jgi:hypothetical protein
MPHSWHRPLEELEVAFVELGLVVAHRVGLGQSAVDGKPIARQQRIEDLHDRLVLEDAAVRAQSGQVQPGAQRELVLHVAALLAPQRRIGDERVDLAGRRAVELDLATDLPADERIELKLRCPRQHQLIGKEPIDPSSPASRTGSSTGRPRTTGMAGEETDSVRDIDGFHHRDEVAAVCGGGPAGTANNGHANGRVATKAEKAGDMP